MLDGGPSMLDESTGSCPDKESSLQMEQRMVKNQLVFVYFTILFWLLSVNSRVYVVGLWCGDSAPSALLLFRV